MRTVSLSSFGHGAPKGPSQREIMKTMETPKTNKVQSLDFHDVISVDLTSTVDLGRIDHHIQAIFKSKMAELEEMKIQLDRAAKATAGSETEEIINTNTLLAILKTIENLEEELCSFEEYFETSPEFLKLYEELAPKKTTRVVGESEIVVDPEKAPGFAMIVSTFLDLAMKFTTKIKIINRSSTVDKCECGGTPIVVDGTPYCSSCNKHVKIKDSSYSGNASGSQYIRMDTFEDAMDEIQGRRKKPIDPSVYEAIKKYSIKYGVSEKDLTKSEILDILKKAKLSEYYKAINLIRHTIQDRPLPCFEDIRTKLRERHRILESQYVSIQHQIGRSNFLNVYFVLRAALQMEGFPVDPEDFISLATEDALKEHNNIMHLLCDNIRKQQKSDSSIQGKWDFVSIMN